jgi:asparagine synthase (glutamine-hydrolysing)
LSGETTYAQGILRVGHGRTMRWRPTALKLQRVRQESLERPPTLAFADAVDLLEQSLLGVITGVARSAPAGAVTNLFSGGIDSTLIQVLLPKGSRCVSFGFDTPEFAPEVDRARAAARLTASEHHIIPLREEDYLGALERFLATVGLPPHHLQSVALAELFRQIEGQKSYLLTGQLADALFGLRFSGPTETLRRWGWLPQLSRRIGLPRGLKPARLRRAEFISSALRQPVGSVRGLAARIACYTDFDFVEKIFGTSEVERRLQKRLDYVLELCPFLSPESRGADAHLEAGHMVDYFCDDAVSIWRQSAMSYGGYLIAPFTDPTIVRAALAFPTRIRYRRRRESKPGLKTLLRRYLPEYDTGLPKLSTGLPIRRFLASGPLCQNPYFTPPDFFPNPQRLGEYPPWIAWSVLTLSAWQKLACQSELAPPLSLSRIVPAREVGHRGQHRR